MADEPHIPLRLFGIPIQIKLTFFLIAFLGAYDGNRSPIYFVEWILVLLVSVLWHELGHALMFKRFGLSSRIELYAFGGLTSTEVSTPLPTGRSILVSFAGPGAGLILALVVYFISLTPWGQPTSALGRQTLSDLLWINGFWSLVNLLPVLPLDGGNISLSLFEAWKKERGVYFGLWFSTIMALLVATLAWKAGFGLGAFLCLAFAMDSGRRAFSQREYLTLAPYQDKYQTFYQLYQSQNWADAERASEELLRNDLPAKVKQGVLVGLTFSRLKQKKAELAWEALSQIAPESLSAEVLQELENLFFELDHNEPARKIAEARFSKTGNAGAAYNVACAHSRLRQIELAFTWLEKARDAGFDDKNQIREDPDLANLRNYPDWEKWK